MSLRVGVFYNLRSDFRRRPDDPPDADAEWDVDETVGHILRGLGEAGHEVVDMGDPMSLLDPGRRARIDVVFSVCEMTGYRFREALVPALCEMLGLAYAFSSPDVMVAAQDKNVANFLVRQAGGHVPDWILARRGSDAAELLTAGCPLIVKPSAEGSGMGVTASSVVSTAGDLDSRVEDAVQRYRQPALVQRYYGGREFTVGVVEGARGPVPLVPMEVWAAAGGRLSTYGYHEKESPTTHVSWGPAPDDRTSRAAADLAVLAYKAVGCRDAARVDVRCGDDEPTVGFLEINPLPHLHPGVGDFCRAAAASGLGYSELLGSIVDNAWRRWSQKPLG